LTRLPLWDNARLPLKKKTLVSTRHQRWYANAGYLDDRETLQHYGIVEFDKIDAICEQTGC
jgi:hypothetical protein